LYIHAVTMENHGPLQLESVDTAELPTWFDRPLLDDLRDLAPYLRHVSNADRMLGQLREHLMSRPTPTGLCFFGDHVPILPEVYAALGAPDGDTDYFIWSNKVPGSRAATSLAVEHLARTFVDQLSCANAVGKLRNHAQTALHD
jgi:phosphoglycerol transferase MdoB-like AlkP superfamily enzyme